MDSLFGQHGDLVVLARFFSEDTLESSKKGLLFESNKPNVSGFDDIVALHRLFILHRISADVFFRLIHGHFLFGFHYISTTTLPIA